MVAGGSQETDLIYPLHFLDDFSLNHLPVNWLFHFNDVLDAARLQQGLERLLTLGGWRKLGGRLRKKGNGHLEIHVPPQYSSDRPAFLFHHDSISTAIEQHPLAASLGQRTDHASVQPYASGVKAFMMAPGTPSKFSGWIGYDVPMLSIRVTTFQNATLLGLSWPHCLMDASGVRALLHAWSLVLAGKEGDVPPVLAAYTDVPADALTENEKANTREELGVREWQLKGLSKLEFLLRFAGAVLFDPPTEVRRIYLPQETMRRLRARTMGDADHDTEKAVYLSDNSILTAWFTRVVKLCERGCRPVTHVSFMNARYRLQQVKPEGVYLQNMILLAYTFLTHEQTVGSVSALASELQRQVSEQATEPQMLAMLGLFHQVYTSGQIPILAFLYSDRTAIPIGFNNLAKIGVLDAIEFAPAVVQNTDAGTAAQRYNKPGTATHYTMHNEPERGCAFLGMPGKDQSGGHWMIARLKPKAWAKLEEDLRTLSSD